MKALLWALLALPGFSEPSGKPLPLYSRPRSDAYELPFKGAQENKVTSGLGWRRHPILGRYLSHAGVDFPKPYGTPVYPARNGVVRFAGWRRGYGWMVELRHSDGARTIYGHLARFFVIPGQLVHKDMLLGLVGSSGLSTGPHLHFECRDPAGRAFDVRRVVDQRFLGLAVVQRGKT